MRVLPSDTVLVQLQVTTRLETETLSMPVACWNPPAWVEALEPGDEIVVVGRVRRRFFRAGGATASRVELEADVIARAGDRRRVASRRAPGERRARGRSTGEARRRGSGARRRRAPEFARAVAVQWRRNAGRLGVGALGATRSQNRTLGQYRVRTPKPSKERAA